MSQRKHELRNVAASVRQRLLNLSRADGEDYQKVLEESFREICSTPVEDDGIVFSAETVRGSEIRIDDEYLGVRLRFLAHIATARIPIQVDVGFGDVIRPRPKTVRFPALLEFPGATLRAYPREMVVAEKFHAMVTLGMGNSRMKDFYDLFVLASDFEFDGGTLALAIRSTFERRETPIRGEPPLGLSAEFHGDAGKGIQWRSFLRKNRLEKGEIEPRRILARSPFELERESPQVARAHR